MSWDPRERPYCDPEFWARRLRMAEAAGDDSLHKAVFSTDADTWAALEARHRGYLAEHVGPDDSVLDVGCAWGRLLDLMPPVWRGGYLGFDIAPAFIKKARRAHPNRTFRVGDLRNLAFLDDELLAPFAWGVACSVERGIVGHLGARAWADIEDKLLLYCRRLLLFDFTLDDVCRVVEGPLHERR